MKTRLWLGLALALITILLYSGVRGHDFLSWDDDVFIYRNPNLQPPSWESVQRYWSAPYAHLYVPVPYTVWTGLAAFFGEEGPRGAWQVPPGPLHLASLAVHLLNVLLAFALLRLLVRNDWAAATGAALFAVHPMQVETVAWASELKDLLGGTFSLAAMWLYLSRLRSADEAPHRPLLLYCLATAAFALALLSKPNTVAAPLVTGVLACAVMGQPARRAARDLAPWALMALVYAILTRQAQPVAPQLDLPIWQRLLVAGDALLFYMGKVVIPTGLSPDYGRTPEFVLKQPWVCVAWAAPAAVLAAGWLLRRRWPWALVGVGAFALALLPALGLTPFDFQQYSTVADHYAYVALLGPALLLAGFLATPRRLLPRACCGIIVCLMALQSSLQLLHWQNNLSFWNHTLAANPRSWLAHNNLGAVYQMLGKPQEAIPHYEAGLRLNPDDADTVINLGLALYMVGQPGQAAPHLERGLKLRPGDRKAQLVAGLALLETGDPDGALPHFQALLDANPDDVQARHSLARCLLALGRKAEARAQLRALLELAPGYTPAAEELGRLGGP